MFPAVTGYLDRVSARPGERIIAHVSLREAGPCTARLVRVVSGDPNPTGPGMDIRPLQDVFEHEFEGVHQVARLGSYGHVDRHPAVTAQSPVCWALLVQLLAPMLAATVFHTGNVRLRAGSDGTELSIGDMTLRTDVSLQPLIWYRLWISYDPSTRRVVLGQAPVSPGSATVVKGDATTPPAPAAVTIGAHGDAGWTEDHFTGKIEAPSVIAAFVEEWEAPIALPAGTVLANWDFGADISGWTFADLGPSGLDGEFHGAPTRAVVGAQWSGAESCWRHAPADYAAVHFHADDVDDLGWTPSFSFNVPQGLQSGAYAFQLETGEGMDWLPFWVPAPSSGPHAAVCVLIPTFTYQAYANHSRGNADSDYLARVRDWKAYPHNPDQVQDFGFSTYNRHPDGSGVSLSSRARPVLTMRPGFLTFNDAKGSGLRHYPADTHLLAWLEAQNIPYDVVTDEDLDNEGVAAIKPYRTVLTGSHPEYHTDRTLDALTVYRDHGGRLCYLGGNGFYWRIARVPARPHLIEVRRAEGGVRAWDAAAGEYYHQLDGALGGLWRRNRRPPQALVGVGFSSQGLFEGTHYQRLPASHGEVHSWIFDGVPQKFGDYGLSGGGAAGFELDRADPKLGTPLGTVILARSEDPPESFFTVPEELLSRFRSVNGEEVGSMKRAEIVYFDVPGGGAVFSVGSITFCGSLWKDGAFGGPVSRLLENVVRRFSKP